MYYKCYLYIFQNVVALVMILVRWCIPDMSQKLRNKIRREVYVTNEIIIHQEALRAHARPAINEPAITQTYMVSNESSDRWNRVMRNSFSTTDFDLEVHGSPISPTDTTPRISPAAV